MKNKTYCIIGDGDAMRVQFGKQQCLVTMN